MNFIGHIELARTLWPERDRQAPAAYLAGSALPDFASMGGFRLIRRSDQRPAPSEAAQALAAGVELHHRTDDLFHNHPWFTSNDKAVSRRLSEAGLNRGAAMACGHVGVELLLDGMLVDHHEGLMAATRQALAGLVDDELLVADLVEPEHRSRWITHLGRLSQWDPPEDYREPEAVAARLQRILQRRPRLAFDRSQESLVADALARQQPSLEAGAQRLIEQLRSDLASP